MSIMFAFQNSFAGFGLVRFVSIQILTQRGLEIFGGGHWTAGGKNGAAVLGRLESMGCISR